MEAKSMQTIELGNGDKLVTDISYPDLGMAGISISDGDTPIGEFADTNAKVVEDLNPELLIISSSKESLYVVIESCKRAIASLEKIQDAEK